MTCTHSFAKLLVFIYLCLYKFMENILPFIFFAVILAKVMVLQSVCGTIRKYTKSRVAGFWVAFVSCPTQFSALRTQAVSTSAFYVSCYKKY